MDTSRTNGQVNVISILLVDDHAIVRQGLVALLSESERVRVVGEAADGVDAVRLAETMQPDVVVMDVGLPGLSGPDATRQLHERFPKIRVLALSAYADRNHVLSMLRAGAAGYVVKDCAVGELIDAIVAVVRGERYVSPSVASALLHGVVAADGNGRRDQLTEREREVLQLLAAGKAMKQAAVELNISTKTVETHRRAIMEKLQIFSVAELTKHAIREGLTTLD